FQESAALRVWYRDSTLTWSRFGGIGGLGKRLDGMLEYRHKAPDPATAIEPDAFRSSTQGGIAMLAGRLEEADTLFARSALATRTRGPLYGILALNRAWIALSRYDLVAAESLRRDAQIFGTNDAGYWSLAARLALLRGDRAGAAAALQRCLAPDPSDAPGLETERVLQQMAGKENSARAP